MGKIVLQTLIVFVFCGMAFGVDSEISWISGDTRPDLSRLPANPTTNDSISFVIPTEVFRNRWQAEQHLGGTPTLIIDLVERRIDLQFEPPAQPFSTATKYDPVSGLQGHFGPLEAGSWLFFVQFQGTIYMDPFYVGPFGGEPPAKDRLTEHFESSQDAFDLLHTSIMFSPTAAGTSYSAKVQDILHLPTNPSGGMNLTLGDDDFTFVKLPSPSLVYLYGSSFAGFYVGSNGYITFTEGDEDYSESLEDHFDTLRVSGLFRDLNPSSGGQVILKNLNNRTSVTWQDVPGYDGSGPNTFQIELFFDGRIRLSWLGMAAESGIVGLSDGAGLPPDFQETDLSELAAPPPPPVTDHLTEEFSSGYDRFDLEYASVMFTPTWDRTSYIGSLQNITRLPTDPVGGRKLGLRDDNSVQVRLRNQARVRIFDQSFPTFFVGANGYVTFTGIDQDFSQTLTEHFEVLRISGLYTDLTAVNEGLVTAKQLPNRVAITWQAVPEFSNTSSNTFQIEMFFDGRIRLSWLEVGSRQNVVGLSNGLGLPPDFEETDFSARYAEP